jgi:hypothetical protein
MNWPVLSPIKINTRISDTPCILDIHILLLLNTTSICEFAMFVVSLSFLYSYMATPAA